MKNLLILLISSPISRPYEGNIILPFAAGRMIYGFFR